MEQLNAPSVRVMGEDASCNWYRRELLGSSGFSVGDGVKIEATETEPDHDFEAFGIPVTACCVLDRLYPGVDPFAKSIRDSMGEIVEDLGQAALQHLRDLYHRFQAAVGRPEVPAAPMGLCC